jgi:hypothetical protein
MSSVLETAPDGIAVAVLLEYGKTANEVEEALCRLSPSWKVKRLKATPDTCKVFQRIRVPALVLYNKAGEETFSAIGDLEIVRLIESLSEA